MSIRGYQVQVGRCRHFARVGLEVMRLQSGRFIALSLGNLGFYLMWWKPL